MFASIICVFVGSFGNETVCKSCAAGVPVQTLCKHQLAPDSVQTCANISIQVMRLYLHLVWP